MPFINIGSGDDLILQIPTRRTQNWNDEFKNNFATVAAEHDHTGTGKGRKIATNAINDDAVNDLKILLQNDGYLRGRNFADDGNINIIKVNASDQLEFGNIIANFNILNDTFLTGRNNGDSADINLIKVDTNDKIATGADFANLALINDLYLQGRNFADSGYINLLKIKTDDSLEISPATSFIGKLTLNNNKVIIAKSFTLADNQSSATDITGATVIETGGKSFDFVYSIFVDATTDLIEEGSVHFSYDGTQWDQFRRYRHDDSQVIFSIVAGQLKYTTPAYTGYTDATLTYQMIER